MPSFAFALAGYLVVAVLLEQYDRENNTGLVWWYTAIIWLAYATAQRGPLLAGINAAIDELRRPVVPLGTNRKEGMKK